MNKKLLSLISVLFLVSVLAVSCSNADKTGSGDNNSGNGGSGTGGDGGTTPTPEGIAKYAGTWTAKFDANNSYEVIINTDGKVTIDDGSGTKKEATDIIESGNTYTMKVKHSSATDFVEVTITFTDANNGTIQDEQYNSGVIRKQNGGNKGLWYYEGNWALTPSQQPAQATQNPTITISNDGAVTFGDDTSTSVTNKGNEEYDIKFDIIDEGKIFTLTLKFSSDNNGTFSFSGSISSSGTMTKQ
ncbi:hypothetical protein [Brachyspira pilosicoli]|uniref:hypothetical protein n=1 Tax=Brachyspira pilosicoli TaxID=52584 RepID=UPI00300714B3